MSWNRRCDIDLKFLRYRLCFLEKLPEDELVENFKLEVMDKEELIGKRPNAEYASIIHSVCKRSLYLKSSFQTRICQDPDLMGLSDSLITATGKVRQKEYIDGAIKGIVFVIEDKLRFLKDFLSNKLWQHTGAVEIRKYLVLKIRYTVYCIAIFMFAFSYSRKYTSLAILAIYLLYEIDLQEQEIEVVCCDGNLILEGLEGSTRMDKEYGDEEIFGAVVRRCSIEVLDNMSNLVNHPQILNMQRELEHINSFLEDLPKFDIRSLNLKNLLTQIAELNIKTRLMIHNLYVMATTEGMTTIMENELPFLIGKAKLIRSEMEKIPPLLQFPKFPLTNGLSFIILIVEKLSNLLSSKIDWVDTIKDNIKFIYEELGKSSLLLMEMSNKHIQSDVIDDLQTQIVQVAYKVEYIVDSIVLKDEAHSIIFQEFYNVKEVVMRINEKIATFQDENKDGLKVKNTKFHNDKRVEHNVSPSSQFMETGEEVVGFEEETKDIIKQLIGGPLELDVISIIGMPGIGKTTLARKVYRQKKIIDHFDILAWCTVSQNYNWKELLTETYKQACRLKDCNLSEDDVADKLRKFLSGKRYLIVLDDMWDTMVWDNFSRLFSRDEEQSSRIIITTRLGKVASYAKCHSNPLPLRSLNHEESRSLLLKKIFQDGNFPEELSSTGETVLGICDGLPLMIVLVAGILARLGPEASEWDKVAKNLGSHVAIGEESMKIIALSYKYLPDHLKPCFLYFGAFREDEQVSVSMLIRVWIAEGFVQKSGQILLEDVAMDYLNKLISCSLIMVTKRRRCSDEVKACGVHDLVREFCLRKSKEENFMMMIREGDDMGIFDHYRLCIELEFNDFNHIRLSWLRGFNVRSLVRTSSQYINPPLWIFDRFKLLRILDICAFPVRYKELLLGIESLLHLRYLAFKAFDFDKIPSNLLNLETLLVYTGSYHSVTLSQTIWRMQHLRHVSISGGRLDLQNYGVKFFEGSSDLENLQSIGTVEIKYCEDDDEKNILKRFPNLRKLKCHVSKGDAEECFKFPKLDFLSQLESLHVKFDSPLLKLQGNHLPLSLKILKLTSSDFDDENFVPWKNISVISALPNLQELVIDEILEDEVWNVEGCIFTNLKLLKLKDLKIKRWIATADCFPLLEELVLIYCRYLKKVPSCFGDIYTLRKIEMNYCKTSAAKSVRKLKEEMQEIGQQLDIDIIGEVLDMDYKFLRDQLRYLEKLSEDELVQNFSLEVMDVEELMGKRPNAEYASIIHSVCKRSLYLKSSLQTRIGQDLDLMGLIDSVITATGKVRQKICIDGAIKGRVFVIEDKLRFLKDFLSNKLWQHTGAVEIRKYLVPKIRYTVYCIAVFLLAFSYLENFTSLAILAIYLLYEIELQEQEIEVVCCDGNLILEGLEGSTRMDKEYEDEEIFGAVIKRSSIEVLDSMSNLLVHHPQILNIHRELEHLHSFLEDLPKFDIRSLNLKNLLSQIAKLNIKTRLMIHKLYVKETTECMTIIMENELPFLIGKAKLIRSEIETIPPLVQSPKFPLTNGLGFIVLIVEKLSNLLSSKIYWVDTIKENIKLMYEELERSNLLLMETSNQHTWNDDLRTEIIQVAYKVEYMVDSIMLNDEDHSNLFPELYNVKDVVIAISKKITMLRDEKKDELNEEITKSRNDKRGEPVPASSLFMTTGEEVVGFEKETEDIVKQLIGGPVELDVISIFGMPGIGKTTLAWKVFHQKKIIGRFDIRAWCTVSQNYNKKDLLIETYKQVCRQKEDSNLSEDEVAAELHKFLLGKRYLIVLDDMWDTKVWDDFSRLLFLEEKESSRIIVTTRFEQVASYAKCHSSSLPLRSLNEEESRKLLMKKIFQDGNFPPELSSIGETILKRCDGLPLMIVLVAGILSGLGLKASEWDKVANNLSSVVARGEDSMKIIDLSYKYLPDHLKPCFLYFGAFKEDEQVSVSKLIRLWIAEGFVRKNEQRILEDVAKDQLNELISCSLIMVTKRRRCSDEVKACGVHDLVREFCLRKSKEENFMMVKRKGDDMGPFIFDHYRLCIELKCSDINEIRLSWDRGFHVRSLVWTSSFYYIETPLWIFDRFKLLRILDIYNFRVCYEELSLGLESLLHLRYLAFKSFDFDKIPSNLLNLETLLVYTGWYRSSVTDLSQTIWRMQHLRHVSISGGRLDLQNYGVEFFEGSSDLENLQSIGTVDIKYCEDDDEKNILKRFPNLRKLKCNVETFWDDAEECFKFPKLDFLCQLESLHVIVITPIPELQGNHLPLSLKILKLTGCRFLSWKNISIISTLPNLRELVIVGVLEDKVWNVEGCIFTNLKLLKLKNLKIKRWIATADSFPLLEELVLFRCVYLKKVPSCFGDIYTLRKIEIDGCRNSAVESVRELKEEMEELGRQLDIDIDEVILECT